MRGAAIAVRRAVAEAVVAGVGAAVAAEAVAEGEVKYDGSLRHRLAA